MRVNLAKWEAAMATTTAATVQALASATQNGDHGACLFALDGSGLLSFTTQETPAGPWQVWQGPSFGGQPVRGAALACAGQNNGALMLAMLDAEGRIWALSQKGPSRGWAGWEGPGLADQEFTATAIAAGQLGGPRGIQLMALDDEGAVWGCFQMDPGTAWSGWTTGLATASGGQPFAAAELAMGDQGDGKLMLVALSGGEVAAFPQTQVGGAWGGWSALGLGGSAPALHGICAAPRGDAGGLRLWALDAGGQVWTTAQEDTAGPWQTWQGPGFAGQPDTFVRIAAADQNNLCTLFVGATESGALWSIAQTSPGGPWGPWQRLVWPPPV
jgi:hypothetical protein